MEADLIAETQLRTKRRSRQIKVNKNQLALLISLTNPDIPSEMQGWMDRKQVLKEQDKNGNLLFMPASNTLNRYIEPLIVEERVVEKGTYIWHDSRKREHKKIVYKLKDDKVTVNTITDVLVRSREIDGGKYKETLPADIDTILGRPYFLTSKMSQEEVFLEKAKYHRRMASAFELMAERARIARQQTEVSNKK